MKKKRSKVWIFICLVIVAAIGVGAYFLFANKTVKTTLTFEEQKWIDSNKNEAIELYVLNDIAILGSKGEGMFFDFLTSLEKDTGLVFNKLSYKSDETIIGDYAFQKDGTVDNNDIAVYKDNYALVTVDNIRYNNLNDIKNIKVGVLKDELTEVQKYLDNNTIKYVTYKDNKTLLASVNVNDAIVLSKINYLSNYNYKEPTYIAYNITEMTDTYYLKLGQNNILNGILNKYYQKWFNESYTNSYNNQLTNSFLSSFKVEDVARVKLRSKRYIYGYVDNYPFDAYINGAEYGINKQFIDSFMNVANIEITYQKYTNFTELVKAFNQGSIDFMFNMYDTSTITNGYSKTVSPYNEQLVIVSSYNQNITINSIQSLKNMTVLGLDNTKINLYLKNAGIDIKGYSTVKSLVNGNSKESLLALDLYTYNYYSNSILKGYKIDYQISLNDEYNFIVKDPDNNSLFIDYLNFYFSFVNSKSSINEGYNQLLLAANDNTYLIKYVLFGLLILCGMALVFIVTLKLIFRAKSGSLSKEDKIKYTDSLTSLKNRLYLNDHIESWDNSEVYPQTIIIIDLNNVAYINDNFGHAEGDKVITEAANILVNNQIPNSEIIRTNGNEFLIYTIGYDEKQTQMYIRKLVKELKELSHNFGAAAGYSVINDGIKTVDDAINEATIDMRKNKEEVIG